MKDHYIISSTGNALEGFGHRVNERFSEITKSEMDILIERVKITLKILNEIKEKIS